MGLPNAWQFDGWQTESGQTWVYRVRAQDGSPPGNFALKRLKNPTRRARFSREVGTMLDLSSQGIPVPRIVDHDLAPDRPWFVMPWFESGSLQAVIEGKVDWDRDIAINALIAVARAVQQVHNVNIAHRDLKPANILIASSNEYLLTDFGLCLEAVGNDQRLTETREAVGSRWYIAPENETGINEELDQRPADFYAFGKIIWALLAQRDPLPREQEVETPNQLANLLNDRTLAAADDLVRDLLQRKPETRLTDWSSVAAELETLGTRRSAGPHRVDPSNTLARLGRRIKASSAVQSIEDEGALREQERDWEVQLQSELRARSKTCELAIAELNRETDGALTAAVTTGDAPRSAVIHAAHLDLPEDLDHQTEQHALVWIIHSQKGVLAFPTVSIRAWTIRTSRGLWLAHMAQVETAAGTQFAQFVPDPLDKGLVGPFGVGRRSTLYELADHVERMANLFVDLVHHYADLAAAGEDPADPKLWAGRTLRLRPTTPRRDQRSDGDVTPPVLIDFTIRPQVVPLAESSSTVCLAHIRDGESGVAGTSYQGSPSQARFVSPSGQFFDALFTESTLATGTMHDGAFEVPIQLDPHAERGAWSVAYVLLVDAVGNTSRLTADDLEAAELVHSFVVT